MDDFLVEGGFDFESDDLVTRRKDNFSKPLPLLEVEVAQPTHPNVQRLRFKGKKLYV